MEQNNQLQKISDTTIFQILQPKQSDIVRFMGGADTFKKEVSFAIQAANANSYLAQATPQSVAKAIYNLAITGLSLNPVTKLAYLIPKKINGNVEAVLMPSYQGLVKLIVDCGGASSIYAHIVYEGDVFQPRYGTEPDIHHEPKSSGKGKNIVAVYGVAMLPDKSKQVEILYKDEIDEIREYSDSYKAYKAGKVTTCVWVEWYGEMSRKTVIKRMWKYIPKSSGIERISQAIELDNEDSQSDINQLHRIESLLRISAISPQEVGRIEQEMHDYTWHQAARCIQYLEDNRLDPISAGQNYGAKEIEQKIGDKMSDESA